ncbi:TIM barrel protein [Nocardia otitidiscaviarum]|uniref:TIM barrel protein n=1 Tax=Nocardia otitidiscaviarum TaxID=1823 RepID=A0A516NNT1_9NOCA|nr:TIM barrel protein [Nocardia otitidiscaviarum]MBF6181389.1 TIM barrel protein [Nocardia otitidiscaviarum]MCP9624212.1 sugar phosphate isomerase/epimerase [Nocardia otitidiscaviarum]QDP80561.1 TIM barrel protein [Nocardia otitidiscaviarum]
MTAPLHPLRIAAAPISWGVCEVPGWGHVLDAHTVLAEMAALGITATEFGPPDYLPADPLALRAQLGEHGLTAIGGFLALPLHRESDTALTFARDTAARYARAGAEVLILAAATGLDGYDERPALTDTEWDTLVDTAAAIAAIAAEVGLRTTLHPHVGTHVESEAEVERFLADSDLPLCLDTGHLLIGGTDPVGLARRYADRIGHIHLKDVRLDLADQVRDGALEYSEAVRQGIYAPLGAGDIDIDTLVREVYRAGYTGWYVIEQDTALRPGDTARTPTRDAERSLRHLAAIGSALAAARI